MDIKGIYFLPSGKKTNKKDTLEPIIINLKNKFKKLSIFYLVDEKESDDMFFTKDEFVNIFIQSDTQLIKESIEKFENISSKNEFLVIIGFRNLGNFDEVSLNCEIAKNLNIAIIADCLDEVEFKATTYACNQKKVKIFASIINDKVFFESGHCCDMKEIYSDKQMFYNRLLSFNCDILTPQKFEYLLYKKALSNIKTVVLPESDDIRILKAADIINKTNAVKLILLGKKENIKTTCEKLALNLDGINIIDPDDNEFSDTFANILYELRKEKGLKPEDAKNLIKDRNYFATMLVYTSKADAMVSGASTTTANTIRPALQIIKTKPGIKTVSGAFLMCLDNRVVVFADCAIVPKPTTNELAGIAISSAQTAKAFGMDPKIAMLSYSTGNSGNGGDVELMIQATQKVKDSAPYLCVDGPVQFDAAIDPAVAKKKMPDSKVAGMANVFIFPDLNCGNICYKAVQRTSKAIAIGPILQGLKKPVNDLSRGCLVSDIVNTILISAIQAGENS